LLDDVRLLILGGTAWLGRALAMAGLDRGHEVACLARGSAGAVPQGARFVRADRDRDDAYDGVVARRWDAVIDVARQPGHVRRSVSNLKRVCARYLFVSTGNVYADHGTPDQAEDAPLLPALEADSMSSSAEYGEAKVACEHAVLGGFGDDRSLIARAGLIAGPGDESGRSGYWPWRFASPADSAGAVLVPDDARQQSQLIDVRDLATWLVDCAENGVAGVFNAVANRMSLSDHLGIARSVTGHAGQVVPASTDWLSGHGVTSWAGPRSLPLWIDDPGWFGFASRDTSRAEAAGLAARPLEHTLADVLEWELSRPQPGPHGAGLTDAEERALLAQARDDGRSVS
jgi:nucleoside-diphosphate-sugar epimerase